MLKNINVLRNKSVNKRRLCDNSQNSPNKSTNTGTFPKHIKFDSSSSDEGENEKTSSNTKNLSILESTPAPHNIAFIKNNDVNSDDFVYSSDDECFDPFLNKNPKDFEKCDELNSENINSEFDEINSDNTDVSNNDEKNLNNDDNNEKEDRKTEVVDNIRVPKNQNRPKIQCFVCGKFDLNFKRHWFTKCGKNTEFTKAKLSACKLSGAWQNSIFGEYIEYRKNIHRYSKRLIFGKKRLVQAFNCQNNLLSNMLFNIVGNSVSSDNIENIILSIDNNFPKFISIISNFSKGSTTSNFFKSIYYFLEFLNLRKISVKKEGRELSTMLRQVVDKIKILEPKFSGKKITETFNLSRRLKNLEHYSFYMKKFKKLSLKILQDKDLNFSDFKRFQYLYILLVVATNGGRSEFAYKQTVNNISHENGEELSVNVNYYLMELLKEVGWSLEDGLVYTFRRSAATSSKYINNDTDITCFLRGHSSKTSAVILDKDMAKKVAIKAIKALRLLEKEKGEFDENINNKYYINNRFNPNSISKDLKKIILNNEDDENNEIDDKNENDNDNDKNDIEIKIEKDDRNDDYEEFKKKMKNIMLLKDI
ncbi:Hypothetical protein SRAE_X000233200 [Strongyloides ratti]|uniref:Uncharacterized protein n=1 Tax=Strongyloides ratti TaxID=34506 RepID=A0A090KXJ0_STRRB|nr:Hypothetical protein SRAE_X000233200 [Strongyloides ratti]CEF60597.1 Hypothetical protein SRAE_X000233200 [Strongyloides ratti]